MSGKPPFWQRIFGNSLTKFQWLIILAGFGAGVLIFSSFVSVQNEPGTMNPSPSAPEGEEVREALGKEVTDHEMEEYERRYETELKEILEKVVGVQDVSVMVNIASTEEVVVEKDVHVREQHTQEKDRENATRDIQETSREETSVLIENGKGQQPVIRKTLKPEVRGVLVVAEGADNLQVKAWILEAVQRVLDVPAHKISVLPKKS